MEAARPMKYILVSGGVLSGIGKGVVASSTAMLLRSYGLRVTNVKIDPYLNIGKSNFLFTLRIQMLEL